MFSAWKWLYLKVGSSFSGWWFEPLWKIWVNWDDKIPNIWENKIHGNHSPPTRKVGSSFCPLKRRVFLPPSDLSAPATSPGTAGTAAMRANSTSWSRPSWMFQRWPAESVVSMVSLREQNIGTKTLFYRKIDGFGQWYSPEPIRWLIVASPIHRHIFFSAEIYWHIMSSCMYNFENCTYHISAHKSVSHLRYTWEGETTQEFWKSMFVLEEVCLTREPVEPYPIASNTVP